MAHIADRRKQGRGWVVRYRTPDGREHSKSHATKTAADDFLATVAADLVRGDYLNPAAGKTQLADWSAHWLAMVRPTLRISTADGYESLLRSRILPRFGTTPLVAIRPSDVQEWIGAMTYEGLSVSRTKKCAIVLKMMMDAAVRDGMVRSNPVVGIKLPRIERHEAAYFAPDVVDALASAMSSVEYGLLVRVLGIGGLRFGESAALTRDRIDLLRRRILVRESLGEVGGKLIRDSTKNYQHRQVPIPPGLANDLAEHLEVSVSPGGDAPVFQSPHGQYLRYRAFHGRVWRPTLVALDLPPVGLHVLRHSAAARLIQAGGSPKAVQSILGHRSAAFTLTVYGHLFDSDLDDLAARLESPAGPTRDAQSIPPRGVGELSA